MEVFFDVVVVIVAKVMIESMSLLVSPWFSLLLGIA